MAEPLARNVHVPDAKLQLLKFGIECWVLEAERRLYHPGYAALKNVSKAAAAKQGERMRYAVRRLAAQAEQQLARR